MTAYVIRRLALLVLTLLLVATGVFTLIRLLPGNAVDQILSENGATYHGNREKLLKDLGLDRPLLAQYGQWMGSLARGDLGRSLLTKRSITPELRARLLATTQLAILALVIALLVAVPVGVLAAVRRDGVLDFGLRGIAILGLAVPSFWVALLMVVLPSKFIHWTPAGTFRPLGASPVASMTSLILPAIAVGIPSGAALMRYIRTYMVEALNQDYVRTARAKGLSGRSVVMRHAARTTLIPVLTVAGLQVPALLGGAVVIEQIFSIPGLGTYMITAIEKRDYPIVQAVALLIATFVLLSNLVVDLAYALVDPRVRTVRSAQGA